MFILICINDSCNYEPLTHFWLRGCAVFDGDHFTLFAQ